MKIKNRVIGLIGAALLLIGGSILYAGVVDITPCSFSKMQYPKRFEKADPIGAWRGGPGPVCIPGVGGCENS